MKKLALVALVAAGSMTAALADAPYVSLQAGMKGMSVTSPAVPTVVSPDTSFSRADHPNSITYRLAAGYLFGDQFSYGLEVGYANYRNMIDTTNTHVSVTANNVTTVTDTTDVYRSKGSYVDLLGVAKYNFGGADGVYVAGKAGFARLNQKTSKDTTTVETVGNAQPTTVLSGSSFDENKFKPELALEAGYNINKNLAVNASYHHVFADGSPNYASGTTLADKKMANINMFLVGLTYNFS